MRVVGVKAKQKCHRADRMWKPPEQRALQSALRKSVKIVAKGRKR